MDIWYWAILMEFVPGERDGVARGGGMVTYTLFLFSIVHHMLHLITNTVFNCFSTQ
jgi:hypothetical protein